MAESLGRMNYCQDCHFVEYKDDVEDGRCNNCGCNEATHITVDLIVVED